MNPDPQRGRPSRRGRERHVSVVLLAAIAVAISAILMATLGAQAVVARNTCNNHPLRLNVAVSDDISPAIERVTKLFNRQHHHAAGRCVVAQATPEPPAAVASQVDGQGRAGRQPPADAWIPDSTLWVDVARAYPLGASQVQPTGITVARSPLVIVMPAVAAAQIPAFNSSLGWNFLLPASDGGPSSAQQQLVTLELPDPTQSAAGLATMVEMNRLLGTGAAARTQLTTFVLRATPSAQFGDPRSLAAFNTLASPVVGGHPVTVTSEQAVLAYDAVHPGQPLAARYPSDRSAALGTPELDYPYVVTSADRSEQQAAAEFGALLRLRYTADLVRYYGFRSANGIPGSIPASDGLADQPLQLAAPPTPAEAQTALQAWQRLQLISRDLVLIDESSTMNAPAGLGGLTLEQELAAASTLGLGLFPDSSQLGDWAFADDLNGSLPYKQLITVGPLPAEVGLITRRQELEQILQSLRPQDKPAALGKTILAGYQQMTATFEPGASNTVIVLTGGVDNAPGDLSVSALTARLRALYNPDKPVQLIIIMLGSRGKFSAMRRIAQAGGGAAYLVTSPLQISKVFFEAFARRICASSGSCPAP